MALPGPNNRRGLNHLVPGSTMTRTFFFCILTFLSLVPISLVYCETKCWKRKFYVTALLGSNGKTGTAYNATINCPQFYSWTINDYCCYDGYDRFDRNPFCCYSETYKLAVAVGLICLVLLGVSFSFFLCWLYNIPHYLLSLITCGKFSLNDYMKKSVLNGPYVDPSFYGEPFWSSANSHMQPYPLRPMPPGIFYPTGSGMKSRWSNQHLMSSGQMPLFVIASRQFTRNPYSARPSERQTSVCSASSVAAGADSRRSSTTSIYRSDNRVMPSLNFKVNIDEVEAAAELLDALKRIENKDKNFAIPRLVEETQNDLDLLDECETVGVVAAGGVPMRRNSLKNGTNGRVGSSNHTNIIPLKSRHNSISFGESNFPFGKNDPFGYRNRLEEKREESEEEEDDEEDENEAKFVVPVKATVTNELGNKSNLNHSDADIYPLESVEEDESPKIRTKGKGRKKSIALSLGNTQSTQCSAEDDTSNKRNIPGLITE